MMTNKNIDNLVSKILNEEIERKSKQLSEQLGEGWSEVEEELHGNQSKLDKNKNGKIDAEDFKILRGAKSKKKEVDEFFFNDDEESDMDLEKPKGRITVGDLKRMRDSKKDMDVSGDDDEMEDSEDIQQEEECNECGDGKMYESKGDKNFIQKIDMKKGALHKKLGIPEGDKIPVAKLKSLKKELHAKSEGDKKLSPADAKLLKQVNLALTLKTIKESKTSLKLTENELIDMIESIVLEQVKKEKTNIAKKIPLGLKKTDDVLSKNKKENDDYAKDLTKKLKTYLKDGSKGTYETNPKDFPKGNGELGEMKTKAYKASDAVAEYITSFAYPGMENIHYDEIKPNEEWLKDNIEGSSKTGNNPEWANAVKTDLGKKINDKRVKNLYQKEKKRSYNRVAQPVDEAGEGEGEKSLDNMFAKLESTENKATKVINEDMEKMKNLISYNRNTQ
jgi:hypothetical protein